MGGRLLKRGELPLVILSRLSLAPRNAFQLLTEIADAFDGNYKPSSGTIYPAVKGLKQAGLIRESDTTATPSYELTQHGWRTLEAQRHTLAALERRTAVVLPVLAPVGVLLRDFSAAIADLSRHVGEERIRWVLETALRDLRAAAGPPSAEPRLRR